MADGDWKAGIYLTPEEEAEARARFAKAQADIDAINDVLNEVFGLPKPRSHAAERQYGEERGDGEA